MILDFPKERIDILRNLRKKYKVILLSNTNHLHLQFARQQILLDTGINNFDAEFDHAFYSHVLKARKPNKKIYEMVCDKASLNPTETIFIDDNLINLTEPNNLGIQTIHHKANSNLKQSISPFITF